MSLQTYMEAVVYPELEKVEAMSLDLMARLTRLRESSLYQSELKAGSLRLLNKTIEQLLSVRTGADGTSSLKQTPTSGGQSEV